MPDNLLQETIQLFAGRVKQGKIFLCGLKHQGRDDVLKGGIGRAAIQCFEAYPIKAHTGFDAKIPQTGIQPIRQQGMCMHKHTFPETAGVN